MNIKSDHYDLWVKSLTVGSVFRYKRKFGSKYIVDKVMKVTEKGQLITERGHEIDLNGKSSFFGFGFNIEPLESDLFFENSQEYLVH